MKKVLLILSLLAITALTGCANSPLLSPAGTIEGSKFSLALEADIQSAANYARANGYPERAQVREAILAQLVACRKALDASKPVMPTGDIGPILLAEMAEEVAASGVPARVKALCAPVPIPGILFPKL